MLVTLAFLCSLSYELPGLPSRDVCDWMVKASFAHEHYLRCRRDFEIQNYNEWTALIQETERRRAVWCELQCAHSFSRFAAPWVVGQRVLAAYRLGELKVPWTDGGYIE